MKKKLLLAFAFLMVLTLAGCKENKPVYVTTTVPKLTELSEEAAKDLLKSCNLGFIVYYGNGPEGVVYSQSPGVDEEVNVGSTVTIYVGQSVVHVDPAPEPIQG